MIEDAKLEYLRTIDGIDFYRFRARLFKYFFTPMAPYEGLFSRMVRETLDYVRGGYEVVYIGKDQRLLGYIIVTRGGGRNKFCTKEDIVLCSAWVQPEERGKGYANVLYGGALECYPHPYRDVYCYIRHNNPASVKTALKVGFQMVGNASHSGLLRSVDRDENGNLGIYRRSSGSTSQGVGGE